MKLEEVYISGIKRRKKRMEKGTNTTVNIGLRARK